MNFRTERFAAQGLRVNRLPADNALNLQLDNIFLGENCKITDITGREVLKARANKNVMTIDVRRLNKGIYLVSIMNPNQTIIQTIIIE